MQDHVAQVRWGLVLATAVLVYVVTLLLGLALAFPVLAVLDRIHPDPAHPASTSASTSASANQVSFLITAFLVIAVTGAGAWWVARRVEYAAMLHGALVGLLVALLSFLLDLLFLRTITLVGLAFYALMVAAGVLGGAIGSRKQARM